jgi:hypothetical protein
MADETDQIENLQLSKPWRKFFDRFKEIDDLKVSRWKEIHFLAYTCRLYKKHHGVPFYVSMKNPPSRCFDVKIWRKVQENLNTNNPHTMKEYIDWVFENKKVKFKALPFFLTQGFVNSFYHDRAAKINDIKRSTNLPQSYIDTGKFFNIDVETYGDLAFIQLSVEQNTDKTSNYFIFMQNLEVLGLDLNKLKDLK